MLQVWIVIGSILAITQYVGLSIFAWSSSASNESAARKTMYGMWLTSKLLDLCICFVAYVVVSWGFAFGRDDGNMFAGSSQFFLYGIRNTPGGMSMVVFTFILTSISMLILGEKVRYELDPLGRAYHILTICMSTVFFPIVLHWAWSDSGWASPWRSADERLLLFGCGTLDTGGSMALHVSSGLACLGFWAATSAFAAFAAAGDAEVGTGGGLSVKAYLQKVLQVGASSARVSAEESVTDESSRSLRAPSHSVDQDGADSLSGASGLQQRKKGVDDDALKTASMSSKGERGSFAKPHVKPSLHRAPTLHTGQRVRLLKEQERRRLVKEKQGVAMQSCVSVLLVWAGTYGISVVSNLHGIAATDTASEASVSRRLLNVTLAIVFAFLTNISITRMKWFREDDDTADQTDSAADRDSGSSSHLDGEQRMDDDVNHYMRTSDETRAHRYIQQLELHAGAMLTGLVAIKGGSGVVEIEGAIVIGCMAAFLHRIARRLQNAFSTGDISRQPKESAFAVHLVGGILGSLSVGFLASPSGYMESVTDALPGGSRYFSVYDPVSQTAVDSARDRATLCSGVFYGGNGSTLAANVVFIFALLTWCFVPAFLLTIYLKVTGPSEFASHREALVQEKGFAHHLAATEAVVQWKSSRETHTKLDTMAIRQLSDGDLLRSMELEEDHLDRAAANLITVNEDADNASDDEQQSSKKTVSKLLKSQLERSVNLPSNTPPHKKSFQEEFGYNWDAVLVFPIHSSIMPAKMKEQFALFKAKASGNKMSGELDPEFIPPVTCKDGLPSAKRLVQIIREAGCETYQYYSLHQDKIICKVRVPLLVLRRYADTMDKPFLLNEAVLKEKCQEGFSGVVGGKAVHIAPFDIYDGFEEGVTTLRPYQYIYGNWDSELDPKLYKKALGHEHEFGTLQRLAIIKHIVESAIDDAPDVDNFNDLKGALLGWFPLANPRDVSFLHEKVFGLTVVPGKGPRNALRNYFGEEIALYFKFLNHYIRWLLPVSALGLALFIYALYLKFAGTTYYEVLNRNMVVPIFALCVCTWTGLMLKFWADYEKLNALRWGTTEFEETERELKAFEGAVKTSFVNGQPMKVVDIKKQAGRRRVSVIIIVTFSLAVIGCFVSMFVLKIWLMKKNNSLYSIGADILNAVAIGVLDAVYQILARKTTNFENCRTYTEYNDSLISKLFVFNFCNSYAAVIYIAFFKKLLNVTCLGGSCMGELGQTLTVVFVVKSAIHQILAWLLPRVSHCINQCTSKGEVKKEIKQNLRRKSIIVVKQMSEVELEYLKDPYENVFTDFNEISVQFGFLTLFATAFPLAPLMAMISNFIEARMDGANLLYNLRRPWPTAAEDIGSWYDIFEATSVIAIFFNAGIVSYTMDLFDGYSTAERLFIYVLFVFACFLCRYCADLYTTTAHSKEVQIQLERRKHLVKKIIERVPDEDDSFATKLVNVTCPEYYITNEQHKAFSNAEQFEVHAQEIEDEDDPAASLSSKQEVFRCLDEELNGNNPEDENL